MNRRLLVILNPAARSRKAATLLHRLEKLAAGAPVHMTPSASQARTLAREAARSGVECVVAAGGDGTVNAVVNGLAGTRSALGILPIGTMNVFATELGLPQGRLREAWQVILAGHTREVDLPRAGAHHFVQLAGAGLDAEVVRRTAPEAKDFLGPLSYLLTLAQVAGQPPPLIHVQAPGRQRHTGRFVLVGNGRHYGGPFVFFRQAKLDDGLLDVLVFKNQSPWDLLRYMQAIAAGSHTRLPDVTYFQAPEVELQSDAEVPFELDGEVCGVLPVRLGFSRARLQVRVPAS